MWTLEFSSSALKSIERHTRYSPELKPRLTAVLEAMKADPRRANRAYPLKHGLPGYWGCCVTGKLCFIYQILGDRGVVFVESMEDYHPTK